MQGTLWYPTMLAGIFLAVFSTATSQMTHKEIDDFFSSSGYDGRDPPSLNNSTEIRVGLYVNNAEFSMETGTMKLSLYFRTAWQDSRLKGLLAKSDQDKVRINGKESIMKLWRPDLFFRNSDRVDRVDGLIHEALMMVNKTGHVWYVTKIVAHLGCPVLKRGTKSFICPIMIESFGYYNSTTYFKWMDHPLDLGRGAWLSYFTLRNITKHDCSQTYAAGPYPCLEIGFVMSQDNRALMYKAGAYLVNILLVLMAWLVLWNRPTDLRILVHLGCIMILSVMYSVVNSWTQFEYLHVANHAQSWFLFSICFVIVMATINLLLSGKQGCLRAKFDGLCCRDGVKPDQDMEHKRSKVAEAIEGVLVLILYPAVYIIAFLVFIFSAGPF